MSSSTSLASARRRKGVVVETSPANAAFKNSLSRMNNRGLGLRNQPHGMNPNPVYISKPAQPQANTNTVYKKSSVAENVTNNYDGIGESTKFEPSDNVKAYKKDDGRVMFGMQDILKIHEKKLVQHEHSINEQTKIIEDVESQTMNCISELDQKCEQLFDFVHGSCSDQPQTHTDATAPKHDAGLGGDHERRIGDHERRIGDHERRIGDHERRIGEQTTLYNGLLEKHTTAQDDIKYLKQMLLSIQSSNIEMQRSLVDIVKKNNVKKQETNSTDDHDGNHETNPEKTSPKDTDTNATSQSVVDKINQIEAIKKTIMSGKHTNTISKGTEGAAAKGAENAESAEGTAAEGAEGAAAEGAAAEGAEGAAAESAAAESAKGAEGAATEGAEGAAAESTAAESAEGAEGAATEGAECAVAEGAEGAVAEGAEGTKGAEGAVAESAATEGAAAAEGDATEGAEGAEGLHLEIRPTFTKKD